MTTPLLDALLALPPPANVRVLDDSVVVFVASVLVAGVAIHVAANHVVDASEYGDAVLTALLGALALLGVGSLDALGVPGA